MFLGACRPDDRLFLGGTFIDARKWARLGQGRRANYRLTLSATMQRPIIAENRDATMPLKAQMYYRTAPNKGFLQHLRLMRNLTYIKGVCNGASKVWLSYQIMTGSDAMFWADFSNGKKSNDLFIESHDSPRENSMKISLRELGLADNPNDPRLWTPTSNSALKFNNCTFINVSAHAMAGYTPIGGANGQLFDPNVGQFDLGQHYRTRPQLWADLWDYYKLTGVTIFEATGPGQVMSF